MRAKVVVHVKSVVVYVQFMVSNSKDIVRKLFDELISIFCVCSSFGEAITNTSSVMYVTRVNEKKVDILFFRKMFHMFNKRVKHSVVTRIVGLGRRVMLVSKKPSVGICSMYDIEGTPLKGSSRGADGL